MRHLQIHQKIHHQAAEMLNRNKILLNITIAFILFYAYLPVYLFLDHDLHQPFLFYHVNEGITWYHYTDYLCTRISILILMSLIVQLAPKLREHLFTLLLLWIGYFVEFVLVFNQPLKWYYSVPLSYSLFAGISMICITFIGWKKKH